MICEAYLYSTIMDKIYLCHGEWLNTWVSIKCTFSRFVGKEIAGFGLYRTEKICTIFVSNFVNCMGDECLMYICDN